ncbi:MAG: RDD family protein [Myxococcaceae bacterium]|nr:RDD family protein [Myxococcaceae bacterium]
MSCRFCGTLLPHGTLVCDVCGGEQDASPRREPERPEPRPQLQYVEPEPFRATCLEHEGMPLLGTCPRCEKPVCVRCAPDAVNDQLACTDCYGLGVAHRPAPAGAVCAVHADKKAVFVCERCGSFACSSCRRENDTSGRCVKCTLPTGNLASRSDRFVANLVDHLLVVGVPLVLLLVVGFSSVSTFTRDDGAASNVAVVMVLGTFGAIGLSFTAQIVAQLRWGQSIGKRLTGIKVVRTDGSPIELWRLLILRNGVMFVISNAFGLIGLVDILLIFTDGRRCIHDHLADSIVIEERSGATLGAPRNGEQVDAPKT